MSSKMERLSDRLAERLGELASDPAHVTGDRPYPHPFAPDEVVALVEAFHEQVDRGLETRAELAKRKLQVIACGRGCNTCCHEPIMVTMAEAITVARWLARPENEAARLGFLERYPAWEEKAAAPLARLAEMVRTGNEEEGLALHMSTLAMCPLNLDGDCSVYPVRPVVCRDAHALDTPANCGAGAPNPVKIFPFDPFDEFVRNTKRLFWAIHHALPGSQKQLSVALPAAVHRLLTDAG
jgi:hypothetical protein